MGPEAPAEIEFGAV